MEQPEEQKVSTKTTPYYKQYYEKNKEKYKLSNKKYREAKKAKIQNEKVENEKKGVVIEDTSKQIEELKNQLNTINMLLCKLLIDKKSKEDDANIEEPPEPIKRYIKSIEKPSISSYTSQQSESEESEDESIISEEEDSSFEIDENGNVI